jgi:hypothetical protein
VSWSLKLRAGDIDVQHAQIGVVQGSQKLVQDFRCAVLEALGNDDLHPSWGSTLDGGIGSNGEWVPGVIGTADPWAAQMQVESEIRRIATLLQQRQLQRLQQERLTYNKVTLTASEILLGVTNVRMSQVGDALTVGVTLHNGQDEFLIVTVSIDDGTIVAH